MKARHLLVIILLASPLSMALAAEFTYTETAANVGDIPLGYPAPRPVATATPGAYFREYAYLHGVHQALALDHATITAFDVGNTLKGETIWAYNFGDANIKTVEGIAEGSVLVNGGIHAREWQTQEATTGLMEYLASIEADGGVGQYLSENLNVLILPVFNIDGFLQTQTYWDTVWGSPSQPRDGRMRRKNMRINNGGTVDGDLGTESDNLFGVDLNRNSRHGFGKNLGSSGVATSLIYRGPSPFSEPETRALRDVVDLLPNNSLRFYEDTHSFSQLMYIPQNEDTERNIQAVALAQSMSFAVGGRYEISPDPVKAYIGTTADHFAEEYGVPSWTLELEPTYSAGGIQYGGIGVSHDGFILPDAEVPRLKSEYNAMHLRTFYDRSGPAHAVSVEIRRASDNALVYRSDWASNGSRRSLVLEKNQALQSGTDYSVWVAFNKPMRSDEAGGVGIDMGVTLSLLRPGSTTPVVLTDSGEWLDAPGDAPDGYVNYHYDAYRATFTMPAVDALDSRWLLLINALDFSARKLDADPATIAGFAKGKWTDFENIPTAHVKTIVPGNIDCTRTIRTGNSINADVPANACRDFLLATTPAITDSDIPVSEEEPRVGRGGGATTWMILLLLAAFARRMVVRRVQ